MMKMLVAFAFVAVATALPEPVQLPEPAVPQFAAIDISPAFIPQHIALTLNEFGEIPSDIPSVRIAEAPVDAVRIADAPADTVRIPDVAVDAEEISPVNFVYEVADTVRIADVPVEEVAADAPVDAVRIADVAVDAAEIKATPVKFVDGPVDAVRVEIPQPMEADPVIFVDSPVKIVYRPGNMYDNPLLR